MAVGFNPDYDYFLDPQQARSVGLCICCGRELYSLRSETCDRCQFDMELEDE